MNRIKRILSFILVICLVITLFNIRVFATDVNLGAGGKVIISGSATNGAYAAQTDNLWGVRFSLYFAEGVVGQDSITSTDFELIGLPINITVNNAKGIQPNFISGTNIYTRRNPISNMEKMWLLGMDTSRNEIFLYDSSDENVKFMSAFPKDLMSGDKKSDASDLNYFFAGIKTYDDINSLPDEQKDFSNTVAICNLISSSRNLGITFSDESWKNGYYMDKDDTKYYGTFKLYFEPWSSIRVESDYYFFTLHDLIAFDNTHDFLIYDPEYGKNVDFYSYFNLVFKRIANSVFLSHDEPTLGMKGLTGSSTNLSREDFAVGTGKAETSMGVGVITSMSTERVNYPRVVKTYAKVVGIDDSGNFILEDLDDYVEEQLTDEGFITEGELRPYQSGLGYKDFTYTDLAITPVPRKITIPMTENVELSSGSYVALLNDVVSPYSELKADEITWENYLNNTVAIPSDSTHQVYATKDSVAAVVPGIITNSVLADQVKAGEISLSELSEQAQEDAKNAEKERYVRYEELSPTVNQFALQQSGILAEAYDQLQVGEVDRETNSIVTIEECDHINSPSATNLVVLRYLVFNNSGVQINVIDLIDDDTNEHEIIVEDPVSLDFVNDSTVSVKKPQLDISTEEYTDLEQVEWVTNANSPYKDVSNGVLPVPTPPAGKTGTTENQIPDYPSSPAVHNLYVKWEAHKKPVDEDIEDVVPQWRLSKYRSSVALGNGSSLLKSASMRLSLTPDETNHVTSTLNPMGTYNFFTINPNGQKTVSGYNPASENMKTISSSLLRNYVGVPANTFFHSKVTTATSGVVTHNKPYVFIKLDGDLNMIKSYDTGKINAAKWLESDARIAELNAHNINADNKPLSYEGQDVYSKASIMKYGIYNKDIYEHQIARYSHLRTYLGTTSDGRDLYYYPCGCYLSLERIASNDSKVSYSTADYNMSATFNRYIQQNTDSRVLSVEKEVKSDNGITTIKYQPNDVLKVYPEVGMLFSNDNGEDALDWVVGDQLRVIKPVVFQTLQFKVYVVPTTNGTSYATDSRAKGQAQALGEATKQVIYKGAGTNTLFTVKRDSSNSNNKGILTVKTFALDMRSDGKYASLKGEWGNEGYNSYSMHQALINNITIDTKATVTTKLQIDSPTYNSLDYVGAEKPQQLGGFNRIKYTTNAIDNGNAVVFEHRLIVRGGQVIGVVRDNRNGGKETLTMEQLKSKDITLYNAIIEMNLYDMGGDRSKTILNTFEHKVGHNLTEDKYASMLATARQQIDGIQTPANASVSVGSPWYSEDTTVLVIKEYVTNYEVPSVSASDKISMSVKGLETPADKSQFFKVLGKGHNYLKYSLNVNAPIVNNATVYFEYSSFAGVDNVGELSKMYFDNSALGFGYKGTVYLVPNVSVTDTTRLT